MTPRELLRDALVRRENAKADHEAASAALSLAYAEEIGLRHRIEDLEASERARAEDMAARAVAAIKSGASNPMTAPADAHAMADRVARLSASDDMTLAKAVVAALEDEHAASAARLAVIGAEVDEARHLVIEVDALAMADRMSALKRELGDLTLLLGTYLGTRPRTASGISMLPVPARNEIHLALDAKIWPAHREDVGHGWNTNPVKAAAKTWQSYLAALDTSADVTEEFASPQG